MKRRGPSRALAALARAFAGAAPALLSSGCLVVSPPEYETPQRTAPYLIASEAFPSLWQPVYINFEQEQRKDFGAAILSEDNGEPVQIALYIDYGTRNARGAPYRNVDAPQPFPSGRLADGPRRFTLPWFKDLPPASPGCHTLTMIASHDFNSIQCPSDPDDMSQLTWQVILCDPNDPSCPKSCPELQCETTPCPSCKDTAVAETQ